MQKENMKNRIKKILKEPILYILLVSILLQVVAYKTIPQYTLTNDSSTYIEYEENIFKGEVNHFRTPVYPTLIKVINRIGGGDNLYANVVRVQKILFIISIILIYYTLKKITKNKLIVILLTFSFAISPATFFWNTFLLTESLALFEAVCLFYLTVAYLKEPKKYQAILIGITLLIMCMTRPSNIYLLAAYFVFWILKYILNKEERKQVIIGFISTVCCLLMVIVYCSLMKWQHGKFGISDVSYINDFTGVVASDIYKYGDNQDIIDIIEEARDGRIDGDSCWEALNAAREKYSESELEDFSKNSIKNARIKYYKYLILKTINLSEYHIGVLYTNAVERFQSINYVALSAITMPLTFGAIYILLIGTFIYIIHYAIKKKKLEWMITFLFVVIAGNIFTTIVGAPFESQRLCLISIPAILMLIAYLCDLILYKKHEEDKEKNMKTDKSEGFLYKLFIKETTDTKLQFFRYVFVGGFAAVVNMGSLILFKELLNMHYLIANILGFTLGLLTNYALSKILVFAKEKSINKVFEFATYAIIGIIGLGFDTLFMWIFTDKIGTHYMISKIISTGLVFIWNFCGRKMLYTIMNKYKSKEK